jgi:hypothetical protein
MKITKMLTLNCLAAAALLGTSLSHSVVAGMPHGDQPNPNAAENALTQDSLEAKPRSEKVSKEIDVAEIKVKVSATSKSRQFDLPPDLVPLLMREWQVSGFRLLSGSS